MADNSTLKRGQRLVESMSDDQRAVADKLFNMAQEAGDYDPAGFVAMAITESGLRPTVVNKGGYTGLFQISPPRRGREYSDVILDLVQKGDMTSERAKRLNLKNWKDNAEVALGYRKQLYNRLKDVQLADAAFNAGPTIAAKYQKKYGSFDPQKFSDFLAKTAPKSYNTAAKKTETREYSGAIRDLSGLITQNRASRGLAPGVGGAVPPFAQGQTSLPGQGVSPPASVNAAGDVPVPPGVGQPIGGLGLQAPPAGPAIGLNLQAPQNNLQGLDLGALQNSPQDVNFSPGNSRMPLPTEDPALRSALKTLSTDGLSYNIPLGGTFESLLNKATGPLDTFLDSLLDRA